MDSVEVNSGAIYLGFQSVDYAKKLECYHVTLNVWEINPGAKQFYQSMGMKPLKTTMELII